MHTSWRHLGLLFLGVACAVPAPDSATSTWRYTLAWSPQHDVLHGELTLPAGEELTLTTLPAARPFVTADFVVPAASGERTVRWQLRLADAARAIDNTDVLAQRGGGFVGALSAALLLPDDAEATFTLRVQPPAGESFACVTPPDASPATWRGELRDLQQLPACAFGAIALRTLPPAGPGGPRITLAEMAPRPAAYADELDAFVAECTRATTAWFGAFPVDRLLLVVLASRAPAIQGGNARGDGGARILLDVPPRFRREQFALDWVLIHEMVHLALPSLPRAQHWLEEGSATYLEPLIQAQAGRVDAGAVWTAMLAEYAQGLPSPGSGGLDDDASWGRTYYGGALFCLLADVRIRERTQNRRSLQDVLRAVHAAGSDITHRAPIDDVLALGDAATGTTVLRELHAAMAKAEFPRELDSLWRDLGVRLDGERAVFDDQAPLAAIRRALVSAPSNTQRPGGKTDESPTSPSGNR